MTKEESKQKISGIVERYKLLTPEDVKKYSEEETKKGFILPLFSALGWDMEEKNEVTAEEFISGDRVDYGFYLNTRPKFYLEAKPFKADLHDEKYARQAIKYSWNKGVKWAVLTDFESVKIFNADLQGEKLFHSLFFEIPFDQFLDRFDQLYLLSKESFLNGDLDKKALESGKDIQKVSVTEALSQDLTQGRKILTDAFKFWNEKLSDDELDEGVQKLLNRLVFIRVLEDRDIEPHLLKNLIREWEAGKYEQSRPPLYLAMIKKFRELDAQYNSNLFSHHPFEEWEEHDNKTKKVIDILYGKSGYYEYDFKVIPADILGAVYENYLSYKLEKSKKGGKVGQDSKKRKDHGIYYTPEFIVDYIIKNTLVPVLDKCQTVEQLMSVKILDPACGSGSFLIKAVHAVWQRYYEMGDRVSPTMRKIQILLQNIYGVDLDQQAVEIARLNLLIDAIEEKIMLPSLAKNIKHGNSLLSEGADFSFNWKEEFPEVFKQGGFDVIIGNPPYLKELDNKELFQEIRGSSFGKYYQGKMDFWYFFLHRSIEILKDEGLMGFITNSYFLKSAGAIKLIKHLKEETVLIKAVDFQDIPIFEGVSGRHLIHIWKKTKDNEDRKTKFIRLNRDLFHGSVSENTLIELPYADVIKGSTINFEADIQLQEGTSLLGSLYNVSQGVVEATDKVSKKMLANTNNKKIKAGEGVFVLSEQELKELNLDDREKTIIKKYLNTNNVKKYAIDFAHQYLVYADKGTKLKVGSGEYAHVKSHLDKMKEFVTSSNGPYGLHRPRENKYFENPKLICKGMFLSPEFCFDENKYYVGFSFSVIIQKEKDYDLKYLLGLLNSSFGKNWFNTNGKKRGVGVDIGVAVFRNFPVHKADEKDQKKISTLVDKILLLNEEMQKITENSSEWDKTKDEIEKVDKKIDQEVYNLYGLTDDEIKTIENTT